ncbi:MAG: biotin transporter BioY [Gemmatimonadaceae bacterium]|nr:biotin transporter BioY [Gloeobacterales cyanobacterium ES-bin-141]
MPPTQRAPVQNPSTLSTAGVRNTLGLPVPRKRRLPLPTVVELLWATVALMLTIGGTLCRLALPDRLPQTVVLDSWPPLVQWVWEPGYSFSMQVAAVLLGGCIGGPVAGGLAQVAYLAIGLAGFPVFTDGGGLTYLTHPQAGYLIAFVPAAICTGYLAFRCRVGLNWLATSCLCGLLIIHAGGLVGLCLRLGWGPELGLAAVRFSGFPLLGQMIGVLLTVAAGWLIRKLLLS